MPNDEVVSDRGTDTDDAGGKVGDRGTGDITYFFRVTINDELRCIRKTSNRDYHKAMLIQVFGPTLTATPFMRGPQFAAVKWSTDPIPSGKPTYFYMLPKWLIRKIGRIPVLPVESIRDAAGKEVPDADSYSGQIALAVKTRDIEQDIMTILKDGIEFDPNDAKIWQGMEPGDLIQTLGDVTAIAELMRELDDVALIEVMRTTRPMRRSYGKRPPRISSDKVWAFRNKLEALKKETDTRERQAEIAAYDEALDSATLYGCAELYFKLIELDNTPSIYTGGEAEFSGTSKMTEEKSPRQIELQGEIDQILHEKGFKPDTLGKLIKKFEKSLEKRAAAFARQKIAHNLRLFDYYAARTNRAAMLAAIHQQGAYLIGSMFDAASQQSFETASAALAQHNKVHATLIRQYPLMRYANFWALLEDSQKGLKRNFSPAHFQVLVTKTRAALREILTKLDSASYVWKGDVMINGALAAFGMVPEANAPHGYNAMLSDIVQRKMRRAQKTGIWKGLLLTAAAIALTLTGVGALVVIGTSVSLVLSLVEVYTMIEDRSELKSQNLSKFGSRAPPSDFWLLLACAGAAADVGGLVKVISVSKLAAAAENVKALDNLLFEAGIKSERVRQSARKLRAIKVDVENAKRELAKVAMSPQSIGGGMNEGSQMAYQLARLGLRKFQHFLLELPRTHLPARIPDTSDADKIMDALRPVEIKQLKAIHKAGLNLARKKVADLDEILAATESVGHELNAATRKAALISKKRFAPSVKQKPSDINSDYNKLRAKHHEAINNRERLKIKLSALNARVKLLSPAAERTPSSWGFIVEDWVRLTPRKGGQVWPEMHSQSLKAVDSIRKGSTGSLELMQSKAIITELPSSLEKAVSDKIREAHGIFKSSRYTDLARDFNLNKFAKAADHHGLPLPKNWRDPAVKIHLEIPILTDALVDVPAVRAATIKLFYEKFPKNAVLRIRTVTRDEVSEVLTRAANALE